MKNLKEFEMAVENAGWEVTLWKYFEKNGLMYADVTICDDPDEMFSVEINDFLVWLSSKATETMLHPYGYDYYHIPFECEYFGFEHLVVRVYLESQDMD